MARVWAVPVVSIVSAVVVVLALRGGKVGTGFKDNEGNHDVSTELNRDKSER
jgi:hypothetical protein